MNRHDPPPAYHSDAGVAQKFAALEFRLNKLENEGRFNIKVLAQNTAAEETAVEKQIWGVNTTVSGGQCYVAWSGTAFSSEGGKNNLRMDYYEAEGKKEWKHAGNNELFHNTVNSHDSHPWTLASLGKQQGSLSLAIVASPSPNKVNTDVNDRMNVVLFEV